MDPIPLCTRHHTTFSAVKLGFPDRLAETYDNDSAAAWLVAATAAAKAILDAGY